MEVEIQSLHHAPVEKNVELIRPGGFEAQVLEDVDLVEDLLAPRKIDLAL